MLREKQNTKKVTPLSYNYHFISVGTGLGRGGGWLGEMNKKWLKKQNYISLNVSEINFILSDLWCFEMAKMIVVNSGWNKYDYIWPVLNCKNGFFFSHLHVRLFNVFFFLLICFVIWVFFFGGGVVCIFVFALFTCFVCLFVFWLFSYFR